jgi:hypothetical protein
LSELVNLIKLKFAETEQTCIIFIFRMSATCSHLQHLLGQPLGSHLLGQPLGMPLGSHLPRQPLGSHLLKQPCASRLAATCCNLEKSKIYKITFFFKIALGSHLAATWQPLAPPATWQPLAAILKKSKIYKITFF